MKPLNWHRFGLFLFVLMACYFVLSVGTLHAAITLTNDMTATCNLPSAREPVDGADPKPYTAKENAGCNFYLNSQSVSWVDGSDCKFPIRATELPAGDYALECEVADTEARISVRSNIYEFVIPAHDHIGPIGPPGKPDLVVTDLVTDLLFDSGALWGVNQFPSSAEIHAAQSFKITAMVNTLGTNQGLFSRDVKGSVDPGHFSVWITGEGTVHVRSQSVIDSFKVSSVNPVTAGQPFIVSVNVGPAGLLLFVDGMLVGKDSGYSPLSGNDLSFVIGGSFMARTPDLPQPTMTIDGWVHVRAYRNQLQ